jgi:predicted short-subunit dehydrogenase-like oxidoreductase (DUF2520 family)
VSSIKKIVILGTGNVAWHLSKALHKAGFDIVQVYGRDGQKAELIATPVLASVATRIDQVIEDADLYLLCISDDSILEIGKQLVHVDGIVAHTSGAIAMGALKGLQDFGVFYPLQSFTAGKEVDFEHVPFLIEGSSNAAESALMNAAFELSQNVYAISSAQRERVHVAAVFANNFSNHMLVQAKAICDENNIPFETLHPLIRATFEKALIGDPAANQTGPAVRNDEKTIAKHLQLLTKADQKTLYELITKSIQKTHETQL